MDFNDFNDGLFYEEPIFRPPSEGKKSVLVTATVGCSFRCSFCYPYKDKKFSIRNLMDIKQDIQKARKIYGPKVERIFLLDGNAFVMKPDDLIEISKDSYRNHPNLQRVSAYAHAKDINRKSAEELADIRKAGLNMVYMGIETGDNELLHKINKRTTASELAQAAQKLHEANIVLSGTIILGLAGSDSEASNKHALETAKLINAMNPPQKQEWYISALTLMIPPGTPLDKDLKSGLFTPLHHTGVLKELKKIILHTSDELHGCIFRSNHASNYLALKGVLAKDKDYLVQTIEKGIDNPRFLRPEFKRGL
ncbi:MAG: B12-binding domain-containing radical SAM protein [Promethearchaeota archaeon]